jgi:radical SAM protein with 4Fe4S-binding SPASM domain
LSILRISIYPAVRYASWSRQSVEEALKNIGKKIDITPVHMRNFGHTVSAVFPYKGLSIEAYAHDFNAYGYDRGRAMSSLIDESFMRQSPCPMVFTNFTIDFNGSVMPCCNLRSDYEPHRPYIIDVLNNNQSIFDIYANKKLSEWRHHLATVSPKKSPCTTCKQKLIANGAELETLSRLINNKLQNVGIE